MPISKSTQTTSSPRDPALDGLRGLAVLLVFLFHYGGGLRAHAPVVRFFGYLTQAGWAGVEVFFVLSGFLITRLLLNSMGSAHYFRNFFGRRALRILPLYAAGLILCAVAAVISGAKFPALAPLLLYAVFLQNIPPLLNTLLHTPPPFPLHHLWSLAVEEQFYLLWPLALLLARSPRRVWQLCLFVFALSFALRVLLFSTHTVFFPLAQTWIGSLPVRAGALAVGGALAAKHPSQWSVPACVTALLVSLAVFFAAGTAAHTLLLNNAPMLVLGLAAIDVAAAAVLALSLHPGLLRTLLSKAGLRALGRVSYGFYVFQLLLQPLFDHLGVAFTGASTGFSYQAVRLLCAFPLTWIVAALSFRFLELPFLKLKKRFPQPSAVSLRSSAN